MSGVRRTRNNVIDLMEALKKGVGGKHTAAAKLRKTAAKKKGQR